jgi:hypothetical protein
MNVRSKGIGWAIYAAGFVIWLFGYVTAGHASVFDWRADTPWRISSFVPNVEAELGLVLMFASMVPIYWLAGRSACNAPAAISSRPDLRVQVATAAA